MSIITNLENVLLYDDINLDIDQDVIIDESKYFLPEIKSIKSMHFKGNIFEDNEGYIKMNGEINGVLILEDSINLEEREFNISKEISENIDEYLENNDNSIDIIDILWQNIVLEVPSRYTEVTDYSKYSGDGWRLISEEDLNKENNPFNALKDREEE